MRVSRACMLSNLLSSLPPFIVLLCSKMYNAHVYPPLPWMMLFMTTKDYIYIYIITNNSKPFFKLILIWTTSQMFLISKRVIYLLLFWECLFVNSLPACLPSFLLEHALNEPCSSICYFPFFFFFNFVSTNSRFFVPCI